MALIKCNECGREVSDKASVCPHCGCPTVGILHIEWEGMWVVKDSILQLFVNSRKIGTYSFMNGFSVDIPISTENIEVKVLCVFGFITRTAKHIFHADPQKDYELKLVYSRITGRFGFR